MATTTPATTTSAAAEAAVETVAAAGAKATRPAARAAEAVTKTTRKMVAAETAAAQAAVDNVEAAMEAARETLTRQFEQSVELARQQLDRLRQQVEQNVSLSREQADALRAQLDKSAKGLFDSAGYVGAAGREGLDAVAKSGAIWSKGFDEIGAAMVKFAEASLDLQVETFRSLLGAHSLREVFDLQSAYARSSFDTLMNESTRIGENIVSLSTAASEPLADQVTVLVDLWSRKAA
jgi:phasin family protein